MNFLENSKELLLVHTEMETVTLSEPVNIMLTPQFYTLKKEILPVRFAYQAKRFAASLFEGLLDAEGMYDFFVYQEGEYWVFIAYDMEKITDFLGHKGFRSGDVSKVFFAQQAVEKFTAPCFLGDQNLLSVLDNTVVVLPSSALEAGSSPSLKFDGTFTPKKGVSLEDASASLFTLKQAGLISGVFLLFAVIFFMEGVRYGEENGSDTDALQSMYEKYPSLQSKYTRENILNKYRTIDKSQRAKRDAVKQLSEMIFKGVTLTELNVDSKSVKAKFACRSEKTVQRLENLAKKAQFKISRIQGTLSLHVEGLL